MRDEARDGVCGLTSSREREALGLPTGMGDVSALTAQLRELQACLAACDVFATHCFLRSSLLFVYDAAAERPEVKSQNHPLRILY